MSRLVRGSVATFLVASVLLVSAARSSAADAPPAPAPPDTSLALSDYEHLGVPSSDKRWTDKDFIAAVGALKAVAPDKLPRLKSAASGPLFAKLISRDNLKPLTDQKIPPLKRLHETKLRVAAMELSNLYGQGGDALNAEKTQMEGLILIIQGASLRALSEIHAGPRPRESDGSEAPPARATPAQQKAFYDMQNEAAGLAMAWREYDTQKDSYVRSYKEWLGAVVSDTGCHADPALRAIVAGALSESSPDVLPCIAAAEREEMVNNLQRYTVRQRDPVLRTSLIGLLNTMAGQR